MSRLRPRLVLEHVGSCSLCGKIPQQLFGVVGVLNESPRICDECISLCLDIIAEATPHLRFSPDELKALPDQRWDYTQHRQAISDLIARVASGDDAHQATRRFYSSLPHAPPESATLADPPMKSTFPNSLPGNACSFCTSSRESVYKMISAGNTYICDSCVVDAAALLLHHGKHT